MTASQGMHAHGAHPAVRTAAMTVGIVFLVVGILGFIPGITTNYNQMAFAGHMSGAMLLGVFQVSVLHNIVHLLFGIAGVAASRSPMGARSFLVWGGVVYLALWIYGLIVGSEAAANFVPLNSADDWLHFVLGVAMIGIGLLLTSGRRRVEGHGHRTAHP
jgi:hypothetical protein